MLSPISMITHCSRPSPWQLYAVSSTSKTALWCRPPSWQLYAIASCSETAWCCHCLLYSSLLLWFSKTARRWRPLLRDSSMLSPLGTTLCCRPSQWQLNALVFLCDSSMLSLPPQWELYAVPPFLSDSSMMVPTPSWQLYAVTPLWQLYAVALSMTAQCNHFFSWQLYVVAPTSMRVLCFRPFLRDSSMLSSLLRDSSMLSPLPRRQLDAVALLRDNIMLTYGSIQLPPCDCSMLSIFLMTAQLDHQPWSLCWIHNLARNSLRYFPEGSLHCGHDVRSIFDSKKILRYLNYSYFDDMNFSKMSSLDWLCPMENKVAFQ